MNNSRINVFNRSEFEMLREKYGRNCLEEEVVIKYKRADFFNKMKNSVLNDRRGEVVFCVKRQNGKIIVITCNEYPDGVFRIPTGGINYGEDIIAALHREVKEELGLTVSIERFCSVKKIRFEHGKDYVLFYSYIFQLNEESGRLLEDAEDDEISEVREADEMMLLEAAEKLAALKGKWNDWGRFRYITTKAAYELSKRNM